jgi:hypothetical protein
MADISSTLVKEQRKKTGAGMMDYKRALRMLLFSASKELVNLLNLQGLVVLLLGKELRRFNLTLLFN